MFQTSRLSSLLSLLKLNLLKYQTTITLLASKSDLLPTKNTTTSSLALSLIFWIQLLTPTLIVNNINTIQTFHLSNIIDNNDALNIMIISVSNGVEPLLTCCIPQLHRQFLVSNLYLFGFEVHPWSIDRYTLK